MSKNTIKKIIIVLIVILSTCTITACTGKSDASATFINNNLPEEISKRFDANLKIIEALNKSGFISDTSYNKYVKDIKNMMANYSSTQLKLTENGLNNGDTTILKAITCMRVYSYEALGMSGFTDKIEYTLDGKSRDTVSVRYSKERDSDYTENIYGEESINYFCMSNAMIYGFTGDVSAPNGTKSEALLNNRGTTNEMLRGLTTHMGQLQWKKGDITYIVGKDQKPGSGFTSAKEGKYFDWHAPEDSKELVPYPVISEDLAQEISEKMNYTIYVLKPDIATVDGQSTLDGVVEIVNKAASYDLSIPSNAQTINNLLRNYFVPLKDESGNAIKILDLVPGGTDYITHSLIQDSKPVSLSDYNTEQKCGYDLVISQADVNKPIMSIRFHEFDQDAYDNLKLMLGLSEDVKYLFVQGNGTTNICYLLEYPVFALEDIYEDSSDNTKVCGIFANSGLGINLYSGKIIKYNNLNYEVNEHKWTSSTNTKGYPVSSMINEYYTVKGAKSNPNIGKSSFMMHGTTKQTLKLAKGANSSSTRKIEADIPRIILRDYLEATYAPGFNDDNLVVFGRKIRLHFSAWKDDSNGYNNIAVFDKSAPVGYFIDKDGNEVANSSRLYITDFCDWRHLQEASIPERYGPNTEYEAKIACIRGVGQECQTIPGKPVEDRGTNPTIEDLDLVTQKSLVKIACPWPSQFINSEDFKTDNQSKQRFWIIATKKGIFNSGLYSGWINTTSTTASMDWWNSYLEANSFSYRLNHQDVNSFLLGNYKYQVGKSGIVILDLDTIAFIQDEMTEESEQERAELIRTIFIIIGWLIICYSILLVPAWILDTNSDVGIDFLTKMTFGNWVAIKYREDIPNNDQSGTKYIGTTELVISVMVLMLVGILLININVFDLVIMLIKSIGNIAQHIEKMIKGMGV